MSDQKDLPTASTSDIDAATWAFHENIPLLSHHNDGGRTTFVFACDAATLARFYGPEGAAVRQLLLARRTLMGIIHGDRR